MDVAFIGYGIMGAPMAANLAAAGHSVRVYARSAEAREAADGQGLGTATSVAEAVDGAGLVITMLTDGPAVLDVALGDDGIRSAIDASTVYVDMSTIAPSEWRTVRDAFVEDGVATVDAPVSGGEAAAAEGALSIMAGGDVEVIDRVRPVLEAMGTVTRVGESGAGQTVKAANQLVVAGNIQLVAEALVLLERGGVDLGTGLEVIGRGLAGSTVIERKREALLSRRYDPGFRLRLHAKDLGIVADTARTAALALPLTAAVTQLVNAAVATGHAEDDHSALYALALEANGLAQ